MDLNSLSNIPFGEYQNLSNRNEGSNSSNPLPVVSYNASNPQRPPSRPTRLQQDLLSQFQNTSQSSQISTQFNVPLALKKVGVHENATPDQGLRKVTMISSDFRDGTQPVFKKTYTLEPDKVVVRDKQLRRGKFEIIAIANKNFNDLDPTQKSLLTGTSGDFIAQSINKRKLVIGNHEVLAYSHITGFEIGKSLKFSDSSYHDVVNSVHQSDYITDEFTFDRSKNTFTHKQTEVGDCEEYNIIHPLEEFSIDRATPEFLDLFFGGDVAIHQWNSEVTRKIKALEEN